MSNEPETVTVATNNEEEEEDTDRFDEGETIQVIIIISIILY